MLSIPRFGNSSQVDEQFTYANNVGAFTALPVFSFKAASATEASYFLL